MNRYSMRIRSDFDTQDLSPLAKLSYGPGAGIGPLATRVQGGPGCRYSDSRLLRQYSAFRSVTELASVVADGNILGLVERFLRAKNNGQQ